MKYSPVLSVCLFCVGQLSAQYFTERNHPVGFEFGVYPMGSYASVKKEDFTEDYRITVRAEATCAYYPKPLHGLGFGIKADYTWVWSNFSKIKPYGGMGIYTRYYLPFFFKWAFFKRMTPFAEFSYNRVNYTVIDNEFVNLNRFNENYFIFPVGIKIHLFNNFNLDCAIQYMTLNQASMTAMHIGIIYNVTSDK